MDHYQKMRPVQHEWLFNTFVAKVPGSYHVTVNDAVSGDLLASGDFVVSSETAIPR